MTKEPSIVVRCGMCKHGIVTWTRRGKHGYTLHLWSGHKVSYKTLYGAMMAGNASDAPWSALAY